MAKIVPITYYGSFDGEAGDTIDSELELTDEEAIVYDRAVLLRIPLEEVEELADAIERAEEESYDLEAENNFGLDEDEDPDDYSIYIYASFVDPNEFSRPLHKDEAEAALTLLFREVTDDDFYAIEDYIDRCAEDYEDEPDLPTLANQIAEKMGFGKDVIG